MAINRVNGKMTSSRIRLVECPVCEQDLRYGEASSHLRNNHCPADFGLSALEES